MLLFDIYNTLDENIESPDEPVNNKHTLTWNLGAEVANFCPEMASFGDPSPDCFLDFVQELPGSG
jgi:hypothetical protein